ncbi:MAG TPA: zf-HC2 domain-containing protein [Candidatus Eremiobacteraceae bacterium]|nr:zf-HC2 domain-containing protein [Candidatus Eremiobacteraceae bacterium]
MTEHPTSLLQSLALGELDRDEARAVMEHADACDECAAMLADAMRGVAVLASATDTPVTTTPVSSTSKTVRGRDSRWLVGLLAAAALLLGLWNIQLETTAASVPVEALVHSHFAHHALSGSGGQAKLIQALDGSWVYVVATGLHPLRAYDVQVNETTIGSIRADLTGNGTGFWRRPAGKITSAALAGPDSSLRWNGR